MNMNEEQKRKVEVEVDKLAENGISCTIEGDNIVCTGDVIKIKQEKFTVPRERFSADEVRRMIAESENNP